MGFVIVKKRWSRRQGGSLFKGSIHRTEKGIRKTVRKESVTSKVEILTAKWARRRGVLTSMYFGAGSLHGVCGIVGEEQRRSRDQRDAALNVESSVDQNGVIMPWPLLEPGAMI
jgi:hypothetical protein